MGGVRLQLGQPWATALQQLPELQELLQGVNSNSTRQSKPLQLAAASLAEPTASATWQSSTVARESTQCLPKLHTSTTCHRQVRRAMRRAACMHACTLSWPHNNSTQVPAQLAEYTCTLQLAQAPGTERKPFADGLKHTYRCSRGKTVCWCQQTAAKHSTKWTLLPRPAFTMTDCALQQIGCNMLQPVQVEQTF